MIKIVEAEITDMPKGLFDPMPEVIVTYADGKKETLFEFYPDEIMFRAGEFIGLTRDQALALRQSRDVNYIQS